MHADVGSFLCLIGDQGGGGRVPVSVSRTPTKTRITAMQDYSVEPSLGPSGKQSSFSKLDVNDIMQLQSAVQLKRDANATKIAALQAENESAERILDILSSAERLSRAGATEDGWRECVMLRDQLKSFSARYVHFHIRLALNNVVQDYPLH